MNVELALVAGRQGDLVTRAQAKRAGYTERQLRTLTAVHGAWVVIRRGVYAERSIVEEVADAHGGLAALRDRAASLSMSRPHLMSHDSAARAWGLPLLQPRHDFVHVTREGLLGTRTEAGVKHHLTRLGMLNTSMTHGMRVTGIARTALDLAREHGLESGAVAIDAARRRGITLTQLSDEVALMKYWPNVTHARAAIEASDPGAETPGETLLRLALIEADLGPIMTQFPLRLRSGLAWADACVGRHVFEFDGRVKFRRFESGGVVTGSIEDALWAERTRQNEINELGLGLSRATWDELLGYRRSETIRRLKGEFALTCERWGSSLPAALLAFADRMAEQRGRRLSTDYRGVVDPSARRVADLWRP